MQATIAHAAPVVSRPVVGQRPCVCAFTPARPAKRQQRAQLRAVSEEQSVRAAATSSSTPPPGFVPVARPEDLPKGTRKEVRVDGKTVLLFWYRNQIYAIEGRSPAEGAYSEGFIRAKFTQDFCIECPATGSLFSLKDGSIVSWYPNNAVLRLLTPASLARNLEIYPVHLGESTISVDITGSISGGGAITRGGSDTSLENNNVYGLEPKVYVEGKDDVAVNSTDKAASAATAVVTVMAVVALVVAGGATAMYAFGG